MKIPGGELRYKNEVPESRLVDVAQINFHSGLSGTSSTSGETYISHRWRLYFT